MPPKAPKILDNKWSREDEDVQLMLAFQRGREEAFRELIGRNQAKVYAMIFRLIGDHAQVEDLTQEVFLRVFRTAKRYQPMAKFSTWIYRIAANVALNFIRSQRKIRISALEIADDEDDSRWHRDVPDEKGSSPVSNMDVQELSGKLQQAIAELPENQKIAITLNKFEHMSYQDIADVLGCSTMAVKSLLSRARCNLRDALVKYMGKEFVKNLPNL